MKNGIQFHSLKNLKNRTKIVEIALVQRHLLDHFCKIILRCRNMPPQNAVNFYLRMIWNNIFSQITSAGYTNASDESAFDIFHASNILGLSKHVIALIHKMLICLIPIHDFLNSLFNRNAWCKPK